MKQILAITLTLIIGLSACKQDNNSGDKKTQLIELKKQQVELNTKIAALEKELNAGDTTKKVKSHFIQVTTAAPSVFNHFIELQGAVVADEEYFLNAKVPGAITKMNLKVGDRVSKGQVVGEIDDEMLRNQLAEIRKRYELANDVFLKQESLRKQNIGSEVQFLSAKNNFLSASEYSPFICPIIAMFIYATPIPLSKCNF